MFRTAIAAAFLLYLFGYANAGEAKFNLVAQNAGENSYSGKTLIQGRYEIFQDGELCLVLNKSQASKIPFAIKGARVCFANQEAALSALNLTQEIKTIDLRTICGLQGTASVNIAGLTTGMGPAARWFTTNVTSASRVSKPTKVACYG